MELDLPRWLRALNLEEWNTSGSLVLAGSIAHGEHYRPGDFGDADLYFIGPQEEYAELLERTSAEPRVHIALLEPSRCKRVPTTFRLFEMEQLGVIVTGRRDQRSLLRTVTAENLDIADLNDILVWRLIDCLSVDREGDSIAVQYVAAKNRLDLGIWLSGQAGQLLAGHANRIEGLSGTGFSGSMRGLFEEWRDSAAVCLEAKVGSACLRSASAELDHTINLLAQAAALVLSGSAPRRRLSDRLPRRRAAAVRNAVTRRSSLGARDLYPALLQPHRHLLTLGVAASLDRAEVEKFVSFHRVVFGGVA